MTGQLVEAQSSGPKVQGVEAGWRLSRIPCASTQKADPVMLRIGLSDCLVDEDSASPEQSIAPDNRRTMAGVNEKKKAPAGEAKNRREPDAAKQLKLRIVLANGVMIDGWARKSSASGAGFAMQPHRQAARSPVPECRSSQKRHPLLPGALWGKGEAVHTTSASGRNPDRGI